MVMVENQSLELCLHLRVWHRCHTSSALACIRRRFRSFAFIRSFCLYPLRQITTAQLAHFRAEHEAQALSIPPNIFTLALRPLPCSDCCYDSLTYAYGSRISL
jgi:hypothetical protein